MAVATRTSENKELPKRRGFNRFDPDHMGEPAYDEATRTFSLSVSSGKGYFEFWSAGTRYTKTTTQSVVWADVSGTYYFYFDCDGVLQYILNSSFTSVIFKESAMCGIVYWNATTGKAIVQGVDEQHGAEGYGGMAPSTHFNLHFSRGARYMQGGAITGLVDGSDVYTGIATLVSGDEDITMVTTAKTTMPFLYKDGADGEWVETAADLKIGYKNGGSNVVWNEWTGSTWQLTQGASSTDYIIYYFLWTNDANNPIKKVIGQHAYSSRNNARDALQKEVGKLRLDTFPSTEAYLMYAYIAKRNGTLEDDGDGNTYIDLRKNPIFANN